MLVGTEMRSKMGPKVHKTSLKLSPAAAKPSPMLMTEGAVAHMFDPNLD